MSYTCSRSLLEALIHGDQRWAQFEKAWPGWDLHFAAMDDDDEVIDWNTKTIWLNCHAPDPIFRAAHAVAHLYLHPKHRSDSWTEQQEADASWMASMWLAWTSPVSPQVEGAELEQ